MAEVTQLYPRAVTQNLRFDGPVLLRDGRPAILRGGRESDLAGLIDLLNRTTDHSIKLRFFGPMHRDERTARFLIRTRIDGVDSGRFHGLCLVLLTGSTDQERISAVASCIPLNREEAEVAFLVEDQFQGKGIGTLMIERLAYAAELGGMTRLVATTNADNEVMLKVFEDCGYSPVARLKTGEVKVEFDIEPSEQSVQTAEMHDRLASRASMRPLFYPESIAVVGVSQRTGFIGNQLLRNTRDCGYRGNLYPVHRQLTEVEGITAVARLADLPEPPDVVVICVAAESVLEVVQECAEARARVLVILSDGFSERDEAGKMLEAETLALARGNGMRIVGPNCLGLINTDPSSPLHLTFAEVFPPPGSLAMSSQSGSLSLAIMDGASDQGLGFSSFISVGNKADVSGNDLLQFWEDDPRSRVIMLYLESFGNPRRFARLARRISRKKPILVVKSTGVSDRPLESEAYFNQIGVVRTDTLEQMFEVANLMSHQPLLAGNRFAVLANSRGMAEICSQACKGAGLSLASLAPGTLSSLQGLLPAGSSLVNPVDVTAYADPDDYGKALEHLLRDDNVQVIIAMFIALHSGARDNIIKAIQQARRNTASWHDKPIVCSFMDRLSSQPEIVDEHERIPSYHFPESAAHALGHALKYANWLRRPGGVIPPLERMDLDNVWEICNSCMRDQVEGGWLPWHASTELIHSIGIATTRGEFCADLMTCEEAAERLAYPVNLRSVNDGQSRTGISSRDELQRCWHQLRDQYEKAGESPMRVEKSAADSVAVHLEISEDPYFGPVALFGVAGASMDLFNDLSCRITPLTDQDAVEMVYETRSRSMLEGYGGATPVDTESIIDGLLRLSWLMEEVPVIESIELSPVHVLPAPGGLKCSVVRVKLRPADQESV